MLLLLLEGTFGSSWLWIASLTLLMMLDMVACACEFGVVGCNRLCYVEVCSSCPFRCFSLFRRVKVLQGLENWQDLGMIL